MNTKNMVRKLHVTAKKEWGIYAAVITEALDSRSPQRFFKDLLNYGCISGMVWSLVFYNQTHQFYDEHYYEIEDIRVDFEESIGQAIEVRWDLKNFFAWFAFEQVAYEIANDLNIF